MIIVVPFSRPNRFDSVIAAWQSQTVRLPFVLVANGPALAVEFPKVDGLTVIAGPASAGGARNVGLEHARTSGAEWVVFLDDDNYCGSRYLEEFVSAAPTSDVITRGLGFVRWGEELWHFDPKLGFFPGHSTAVRVSMAPKFPELSGGEELPWSRELMAKSPRVTILEPWHLVYDRTGNVHSYDCTHAEFLRTFGPATPLGEQPNTFVDQRVVIAGEPVHASDEDVFLSLEARLLARAGVGQGLTSVV